MERGRTGAWGWDRMKGQDRKEYRGQDKISHCRMEIRRLDREGARTLARRWDGVRFRARVREKSRWQ